MALPFGGFLVRNGYPWLCAESLAGFVCLLGFSALTGALRGAAFRWLLAVLALVVSAAPVQRELVPLASIPLAWVTAALALCLAAGVHLAGPGFERAAAFFGAGVFLAQVAGTMGTGRLPQDRHVSAPPAHVLHLVLDEHMSAAGLPEEREACRSAASAIRYTFARYGFALYEDAHSNYATTFDSLGSLLAGRTLHHRREMLLASTAGAQGVYRIDAAARWAELRSRGFRVRVLSYRGLDYLAGSRDTISYDGSLRALARLPGSWTDRFRLLVGHYQALDPITAKCKGFFPFRFGLRMVFPLWTEPVWPDRLMEEIASAHEPTYFFAHILSPHGPYVYRPDGALRPLHEWAADQDYRRLNRTEYADRYDRYAGQILHLQNQVRRLFGELERRGLLERMTVIVHGDHGSRIRMRRPETVRLAEDGPQGVDRFDFEVAPPRREVLDRFSILFAVRRPGLQAGSRAGSAGLLRLAREAWPASAALSHPDEDGMFLYDRSGVPHRVPAAD